MTHRCNMNCPFCCKGLQENVDISESVIDKLIDELSNCYIHSLVVSGGEPMLMPKMINYLIKGIINKHIYIGSFDIITNGTIKDQTIVDSLINLSDYLKSIEYSLSPYFELYNPYTTSLSDDIQAKINIMISVNGHKSSCKEIESTKDFYSIANVINVFSDEKSKRSIVIAGNCLNNHKTIIPSTILFQDYKFENHYPYNLIQEFNYSDFTKNELCDSFIKGTVNVSANGNIFFGDGLSYEYINNHSPFNIMDCKNNLYKKIDLFSWNNPINEKISNIKMKNDLYNWCSNNGHCIVDKRKEIRKTLDECLLFSKEYEKISRQLHNNSPYLNHTEVDYISTLLSALLFIEDNTSIDDVKQILYYCSEFDMSLISILSKEFIEKLLLAYIDNANNRKNQTDIVIGGK